MAEGDDETKGRVIPYIPLPAIALFTCSNYTADPNDMPAGCHGVMAQPAVWMDGHNNPYCEPCAKKRFAGA